MVPTIRVTLTFSRFVEHKIHQKEGESTNQNPEKESKDEEEEEEFLTPPGSPPSSSPPQSQGPASWLSWIGRKNGERVLGESLERCQVLSSDWIEEDDGAELWAEDPFELPEGYRRVSVRERRKRDREKRRAEREKLRAKKQEAKKK